MDDLPAENRRIEDIFTVSDIRNPESRYSSDGFIGATLKGLNKFGQVFYGKTIGFFGTSDPIELPQFKSAQDFSEDAPQSIQQGADFAAENAEQFTNIRELLAYMQEMSEAEGTEEGDNEETDSFTALEQEFEDVLTYHEMRKDKLRDALSKS